MMRRTQTTILSLLMVAACGDSSEDSETADAPTEGSATATEGTGSATDATSATSSPTTGPSATATTATTATTAPTTTPTTFNPSDGSTSTAGGSTGETAGGSESTAGTDTAGVAFHPEFIWIADFVREKCVACHNMGQNGNLLLPSVDMTNDEVRLALDGGVATTGRLFVEPFDTAESQVYIMITNAAGEQFPMETIDRVAAWINLGTPYFEE